MQLKSAQFSDPRYAAVRQLDMQDAPAPGAGGVAEPSNSVGDEGGAPAPGEREELEAQIAVARGQASEVADTFAAHSQAHAAASAEDQQAFDAVRKNSNEAIIAGNEFEKLSGGVRELATSWNATFEIVARLAHPQHRLELLQYELRAKFPASASLPVDTSGTVVIHAAQKKNSERDPSRAFKAMMKEAAKPARISFPKFIAQQMMASKCSVEALDLQMVSMHPDYAHLHADVQKLVNAFLALNDTGRRIPDILDRIGRATEEIEKALAEAAPVAVRKPAKKRDPGARLKDFEACLAQNGPTGRTRDKFAIFLASLMYQNAWVAANLHWESASDVPGLKKQDFRVQVAFESFLKLTPDERAAHCVGVAVRHAGDEIVEAKKGPYVLGPQASAERKKMWEKARIISQIPGESRKAFETRFLAANPELAALHATQTLERPSIAPFTSDSDFDLCDEIVAGLDKIQSLQRLRAEGAGSEH